MAMPIPIQAESDAGDDLPWVVVQRRRDIGRARHIESAHDEERHDADDRRRSLGLHRHRADLALHLLALAQHAREIAHRFGKIAARLRLNADDDGEEIRLRDSARAAPVVRRLRPGSGPCDCDSTISRNSAVTGSEASAAMMRKQSPSGRPALTPRTMMSIALGNSATNLLMRRAQEAGQHEIRQPQRADHRHRPRCRQADASSGTPEHAERQAETGADDQKLPRDDGEAGLLMRWRLSGPCPLCSRAP